MDAQVHTLSVKEKLRPKRKIHAKSFLQELAKLKETGIGSVSRKWRDQIPVEIENEEMDWLIRNTLPKRRFLRMKRVVIKTNLCEECKKRWWNVGKSILCSDPSCKETYRWKSMLKKHGHPTGEAREEIRLMQEEKKAREEMLIGIDNQRYYHCCKSGRNGGRKLRSHNITRNSIRIEVVMLGG